MENSTPSDLNIGEGIAIIGLSGRFPGADSVEEFWENLLNGRDCITKVPGDRHPYFQGDSTVDGGYLKCKVDEFDGNFFNLSPRDCGFVDPQQRLFLEASWESLENAGIPPSSLRGTSTGVFLGMSGKEYEAILRGESSQPKDFLREMHGNAWSGASGRLSHFLDLRGPCIGVEATCASATVAIHLACLSLKDGETDLCLAAGVNLILEQPQRFPPTLLSSRCKTFDTDADGFVTAEGVGVFVLKRYKDALLAGNRILGVIRGSAVGHDGSTRSFGTPNPDAQAKIMNRAFEKAGIKPLDINYVEVHGTGKIFVYPFLFYNKIKQKFLSNRYACGGLERNEILGKGVPGFRVKQSLLINHRSHKAKYRTLTGRLGRTEPRQITLLPQA